MTIADRDSVAAAILAAPGWARVGITSRKASQREDAALELAKAIEELTAETTFCPSADQLSLML